MLTITKQVVYICASIALCSFAAQAQVHKVYAANKRDTVAVPEVQIQAQFPGGAAGWRKYLESNLNIALGGKYIKLKKGEASASQTILISFLVDKTGKVSETIVENPEEVHHKLAAESIRVISQGPDWIPATINGLPVIYRQKQSITFQVDRG